MNKWSINNHANDVRVYFEPDCAENELGSTVFPQGLNVHTLNIYNYTFTANKKSYKIRSFGPDQSSTYFKSSCGVNHFLSQLKSNVSMLDEKLRHTDFRAVSTQIEVNNLQKALRAVESTIDNVEKQTEKKFQKVNRTIQLLFSEHDASQKHN